MKQYNAYKKDRCQMNKEEFIQFKYEKYGEMLPYERYKLYTWVKEYGVKRALDVGTGSGVAAYYISQGIKNNSGQVLTCDPFSGPLATPKRESLQVLLKDNPNIKFSQVTSTELIDEIINHDVSLDFVFFDGPEDVNVAIDDIQKLEKHLKSGFLFSMHDWEIIPRNYDNQRSFKSAKIRPYIENSEWWEKIEVLSGLEINSNYYTYPDKNCDSVGLCLYKFLGNSQ